MFQVLGWQQFVICLNFVIFIFFWYSGPGLCLSIISYMIILYLHTCMMSSQIVHNCIISLMLYIFVHIEVSYRGSFAQRGPTYRGGLPRVDNREHGSAATWKSPCPPPETSGVIFSDFHWVNSKHKLMAKYCAIDLKGVDYSFDILIHLLVIHLVLPRVGNTDPHLIS